jgi:vacuolar-type H+-ATPase subunit H
MGVSAWVRARASAALYDGPVDEFQYDAYEPAVEQMHEPVHESDPDALSAAPGRVASIVGAAERAAADLRDQTEARARERIAEGERAAENRVHAAEEEAAELLSAAHAQAQSDRDEMISAATQMHSDAERAREEAATALEQTHQQVERLLADARIESEQVWATAHQESERLRASATADSEQLRATAEDESKRLLESSRAEAERVAQETRQQTDSLLASRREELARVQAEAEDQAREIKARARDQAREITSDAHVVAHDILAEGTDVSRNLRELSVSLRNNAERLLRDVRLTHGGMTARLDQVVSGDDRQSDEPARGQSNGGEPARGFGPRIRGRRKPSDSARGDDLDVPEFIPRG